MTGAPGLTGASLGILPDPHALRANSLKTQNQKNSKYYLLFPPLFLQRPHIIAQCCLQDVDDNSEGVELLSQFFVFMLKSCYSVME